MGFLEHRSGPDSLLFLKFISFYFTVLLYNTWIVAQVRYHYRFFEVFVRYQHGFVVLIPPPTPLRFPLLPSFSLPGSCVNIFCQVGELCTHYLVHKKDIFGTIFFQKLIFFSRFWYVHEDFSYLGTHDTVTDSS